MCGNNETRKPKTRKPEQPKNLQYQNQQSRKPKNLKTRKPQTPKTRKSRNAQMKTWKYENPKNENLEIRKHEILKVQQYPETRKIQNYVFFYFQICVRNCRAFGFVCLEFVCVSMFFYNFWILKCSEMLPYFLDFQVLNLFDGIVGCSAFLSYVFGGFVGFRVWALQSFFPLAETAKVNVPLQSVFLV